MDPLPEDPAGAGMLALPDGVIAIAPAATLPAVSPRNNVLDLSPEALSTLLAGWGAPRYRTRQILDWVWRKGGVTFSAMTDLPAALRERLAENLTVLPFMVAGEQVARDGTRKALLRLEDGRAVETVLMFGRGSAGRPTATVCVSTQVGCPARCDFCATGFEGFTRNLSAAEITGQVLHFQAFLRGRGERPDHVTNVVFMGQGEPLLNLEPTLAAVAALTDPDRFGLGDRHITLSTVGIIPGIRALAERHTQVGLAVSLHAPDDELRNRLVPVNRKYPITPLLAAVREFIQATGRRVTFEYTLLDGVNDSPAQARRLVERLRGMRCHVNLIPMNPVPGLPYRPSPESGVRAFREALEAGGIAATVRIQRGADIMAACGQLKMTAAESAPAAS
jgi:23S rRNA (adenine2503-C2)-methyltransferase